MWIVMRIFVCNLWLNDGYDLNDIDLVYPIEGKLYWIGETYKPILSWYICLCGELNRNCIFGHMKCFI